MKYTVNFYIGKDIVSTVTALWDSDEAVREFAENKRNRYIDYYGIIKH